jgi:hypothetical protein
MVVRSEMIESNTPIAEWSLQHPSGDESSRPIGFISSSWVRPFIYRANTYMAQYDVDLGVDYAAPENPPYQPIGENMRILRYSSAGELSGNVHRVKWSADEICNFKMTQVAR